MKRILFHEHWGSDDLKDRKAKIYLVKDYFEVEFYKLNKLVETRKMITDGVIHSESYAESAAENWCIGVI